LKNLYISGVKEKIVLFILCSFVFSILHIQFIEFNQQVGDKTSTQIFPKEYIYLPSLFIYKDLRKLEWLPKIQEKYEFDDLKNIYYHDRSNLKLLRGSPGVALALLPAFYIAHTFAKITGFDQDGFSLPYQLAIYFWKVGLILIGLFLTFNLLSNYFGKTTAFITVFTFLMTTQILEVLTAHEFFPYILFVFTSILLFYLDKFWTKPNLVNTILLSVSLGMVILIDLNNLVFLLLIALWKISPKIYHIKSKITHYLLHFKYYAIISVLALSFLSIHVLYTYHLLESNEFYNYDGRIFGYFWYNAINSWFSVGYGWLVYSPIILLSILGFITLFMNQKRLFYSLFIFFLSYQIVYSSSNITSFNQGIGNSYMLGIYPVMMLTFGSFIKQIIQLKPALIMPTIIFILFCGYYNNWTLYHTQKGNFIASNEMTKDYFFHVVGRENLSPQTKKLLDTEIIYDGVIKDSVILLVDKLQYCLNKKIQYTRRWEAERKDSNHNHVRFILDAKTEYVGKDIWHYAQMLVSMYNLDTNIKNEMIRVQRFTKKNEWSTIWIDAELPEQTSKIVGSVWNAENDQRICFRNLKIYTYKAEENNGRKRLNTN
jgi:hypothetical protein